MSHSAAGRTVNGAFGSYRDRPHLTTTYFAPSSSSTNDANTCDIACEPWPVVHVATRLAMITSVWFRYAQHTPPTLTPHERKSPRATSSHIYLGSISKLIITPALHVPPPLASRSQNASFTCPSRATRFRRGGGGPCNTTPLHQFVSSRRYGSTRYGTASLGVVWCLMATDVFRVMGRASRPMSAVQVRELDRTDITLLGEEKGSRAAPLKRLSERHHALARCLASGMEPGDAAITCGYVASRVSILQADPAFQELLAFYRQSVEAKYLDMHGVLAGLSLDAATELRERLEADIQADEKTMSVGQLVELTKLGADRTGFGPQSSQLNVNVDLAGRLQAARERVAQRRLAPPEEDAA